MGKEFGVISFESVSHAMRGESVFNKEDINFRTIPTPREISHSCGIAIRFDLKDLELANSIIEANKLNIKHIYKLIKDGEASRSEKIK